MLIWFSPLSRCLNVYMCLPVWREWKLRNRQCRGQQASRVYMCLPVRREWKLISNNISYQRPMPVYMCLPVWREWKPHTPRCGHCASASTCAFPFGGNGSWKICWIPFSTTCLSLHVPSRLEGMETVSSQHAVPGFPNWSLVYMCLPVWREWKHFNTVHIHFHQISSTCAFPFGGNGNSRRSYFVTMVIFFLSTCAFPFGGNGNFLREDCNYLVSLTVKPKSLKDNIN